MYPLTLLLELMRFVPLIAVMAYAAILDYKTGEVPNKIWRYTIIGGAITALETIIYFSLPLLLLNLIVIAISVALGFLMFKLGGGGADSKAFMMIAISAPLFPYWSFLWPIPLPFVVLFVACIFALPPLILRKESKDTFWQRKIKFIPYMFIGLIFCVIL